MIVRVSQRASEIEGNADQIQSWNQRRVPKDHLIKMHLTERPQMVFISCLGRDEEGKPGEAYWFSGKQSTKK